MTEWFNTSVEWIKTNPKTVAVIAIVVVIALVLSGCGTLNPACGGARGC